MEDFKVSFEAQKNIGNMFDAFLMQHRYKKGVHPYFTHTEMNNCKGAYYISDNEYSQFISLYSAFIKEGYEIGIVERHDGCKVGPLISDFDFRSRNQDRSYTQKHIKNIIKIFVEVINDIFNVKNEQLEAYVYEKDTPTMDKKETEIQYKDGFHIFFPYLPLSVEYRTLVYDIVLKKLKDEKTINEIPSIEPLTEVYDPRVIYSNGIMMYGSVKPGRTPYELTHVYNYDLTEIDIELFDFQTKIDTSLLRTYDDESSLELKEEKKHLINNKNDKEITIDEKIEILKQEKKQLKNEEREKKKQEKEEKKQEKENKKKEDEEPDIVIELSSSEIYEKILLNLKDQRFKNYDEWLKIGLICIRNDLYEIFDKYSKLKAPEKYNKQQNLNIITGLYKKEQENKPEKKVTEKTLLKWLKIDNEDIYNELKSNNIKFNCITAKDYSTILIDLLDDLLIIEEVITTDGKPIQRAYKWNNVFWEMCSIDTFLINYISTNLVNAFKNLINKKALISDYVKNNKSKILDTIRKNLETPSKIKEVINIFKPSISKTNIEWNKNPKLFVFNNAIYDLDKGQFIEPNKEDYMNLSCGYDYDFKNSYEKEIKTLHEFYSDCLDEESKETLLMYNASSLKRYNIDQMALFCTGSGGNGKGLNITLLKHTLGNYCKDLPMDYFTTVEKHADAPNTPLAECRNAHLICLAEAEQNENENGVKIKINKSKFKKCTGQDEIMIRPTFEKVMYRFNMGNIILSTNNIPDMDAIGDQAILRRILIVQFVFSYVDNPNPDNLFEKKKKPEFQILFKSEAMRQAYIRILLSYYDIYRKEGLKINNKVKETTKNILNKQCDVYNCITEMIETGLLVKDNSSSVSFKILHNYYSNCDKDYKFASSYAFTRDLKKITEYEYKVGTAREMFLCKYKFIEPVKDDKFKNKII